MRPQSEPSRCRSFPAATVAAPAAACASDTFRSAPVPGRSNVGRRGVLGTLALPEFRGLLRPGTGALRPGANAPGSCGFTLIELILVMAILTIMVSITAPTLGHFFSGRALDSEARRLLSLTRSAQSRAASEGMPMDLWISPGQRTYGLELEATSKNGGDDVDSKGRKFDLDRDVKIEVSDLKATKAVSTRTVMTPPSTTSVIPVVLKHANLPTIRFLPDGFVGETSPQSLQLTDREGASLWLTLSRTRSSYEIRSQPN
jgi:prepilin-type N-terminal cleavage/methylation domain-containing protein